MTPRPVSDDGAVRAWRTGRDTGERLSELPPLAFGPPADYTVPSVALDARKRFQTIEGFGAMFTESAAVTLQKMAPEVRLEALRACFDPEEGNSYTLCRTHINSCDYSTGNYAYTEVAGDVGLEHFSVERDRQALMPMIRDATAIAGRPLQLLASPWSPPAWMKTTGRMNRGGRLKPECRDAWARYYARYVREYEKEGIPIWGLSVQNEPEATQTWDSCIYTAEEERDFVRDHLGPTLDREGLSHLKLLIWDHNRDRIVERAAAVYDDPEAARYVWGTAFHWYMGDLFDNVLRVHEAWPDKALLFSEGYVGPPATEPDSWDGAEYCARCIINDLNHWTVGWIGWNMVVDEAGGPCHVGSVQGAPIVANTRRGTLERRWAYYCIGHFSRHIRPGARRIPCASTRDQLQATAFVNTDGQVAVVVLNQSDGEEHFALKFGGHAAMAECPAHSITTLRFSS